jgi:hypothetical protein
MRYHPFRTLLLLILLLAGSPVVSALSTVDELPRDNLPRETKELLTDLDRHKRSAENMVSWAKQHSPNSRSRKATSGMRRAYADARQGMENLLDYLESGIAARSTIDQAYVRSLYESVDQNYNRFIEATLTTESHLLHKGKPDRETERPAEGAAPIPASVRAGTLFALPADILGALIASSISAFHMVKDNLGPEQIDQILMVLRGYHWESWEGVP